MSAILNLFLSSVSTHTPLGHYEILKQVQDDVRGVCAFFRVWAEFDIFCCKLKTKQHSKNSVALSTWKLTPKMPAPGKGVDIVFFFATFYLLIKVIKGE